MFTVMFSGGDIIKGGPGGEHTETSMMNIIRNTQLEKVVKTTLLNLFSFSDANTEQTNTKY